MAIVVAAVTSYDSIADSFDAMYSSSLPYMNADNNPWTGHPVEPAEEDKASVFRQSFFGPLAAPTGYCIIVYLDNNPISLFSGVVEDNLFKVYYALYNNVNGSRTWLYDGLIMQEHLTAIKNYFSTHNVTGYVVTAPINSTLYNYHKLNKPVLGMHTTITETAHPQVPNVVEITYLF
jgi:hypothetical protein